jgi:transposase
MSTTRNPSTPAPSTAHAPAATPATPATPGLYVGIDVAKQKLDLARASSDDDPAAVPVDTFVNDPAGIAAVVRLLAAAKPAMIVVESTGGLERPLLEALLEANLPAALVHPGRVHFAKGMGILAKTDRIDARVLARFGRHAAPRLLARCAANQTELRDLVACRRQLSSTRAQQTNRRGATFSKAALKSIDAVVKTLDKQIERLDKQIRDLIDADDDFKHLDGLLQSVPGVGPTLSATLAADLRELGAPDRRTVCALAGVAPYPEDSGTIKGKRSIRGGRADVRCVLYMATLAAIRVNPVIKPFHRRLRDAGKVAKLTIVACMRKLLSLLNAMIRDDLSWDQLDVVKKLASTH